ncbi:GNAT family N-acetyltransferase [Paenibacillus arenosi]|uniref:GNAT family N-acetyltransferase n=1 Tax=Paenibacillus arenosi TaxID=2774142 RepID=A0ABR9B427_9BACL|nr:GNAT family N-acetyltransferase [Paenibacillus arenosi]MBD8501137.1 GNAT family N-acetyltransferase [Paenibacillus arenosi]
MIRMTERNEWLASKLVTSKSDMMFAGVVVGHNPGEVWVDHALNPSTALVWSNGLGCFTFMGNASNMVFNRSLANLMEDEIIPFLKKKNISYFEFSVDSEDWYPAIYQHIGNRKVDESYQYVYKSVITPSSQVPVEDKIGSFQVVEIDEALLLELDKREIKNTDFLVNYIEQYWGTVSNYIVMGYGYAALTESNEVASIAVSSAKFQTTHTIGVETLESYQQQGLSSGLVTRLLQKFHEQRISAWWDCMESNIASQKTAEKAGLERSHRYKINWFHF